MNNNETQERGRTVGLDLHPSCFTASALVGNNPIEAKVQWTHDKVSYETLESWASKHLRQNDIIVMESGSNSFDCCTKLIQQGLHCIVLESFSVGRIGSTYVKNDKIDSVKCARVYLSGLAKEVWKPDEQCKARREMLALYRSSVKDCTRTQNRLTAWCTQHGLQRPKRMKWGKAKAREWLLKAAVWSELQTELIVDMFDDLDYHTAKRKKYSRIIAKEVMTDKTLMLLLQIKGIRHITAFAIGAIVGDISRFRNPKKLVAYIGLNPKVDDSGITSKQRHLCKNGRKDVRSIIVQGAQAVLRLSPETNKLSRWGQAMAYKKGKNTAVIAVCRKMIVAVWYLMRGFEPDLKEADKHVMVKLAKIASDIGRDELKAMGYNKIKDFIEEKSKFVVAAA